MSEIIQYGKLLHEIKARIRQAQVKAALSVNAEMIIMYWDIGGMIQERQQQQGWASSVIPKLSRDLKNDIPEVKGFSERNLGRMVAFFREYPNLGTILPQPVAKLDSQPQSQQIICNIPWGHHSLLMEKIKDQLKRVWYMKQTIENGWSRDTLALMIKNDLYNRQGQLAHNFDKTLSRPPKNVFYKNTTISNPPSCPIFSLAKSG